MNRRSLIKFLFCFFIFICDAKGQVITNYNTGNSPLPFNSVRCLEVHNSGLWIGTDVGLAQLENDQWEVYNAINSPLYSDDIRAIKSDGDTLLWIGTVQGGLFSFNGSEWTNYNIANSGLLDNLIRHIDIDQNGNIWLATTEGIFMYDRSNWHHWNMQENGLLTNNITSIEIGLHNEKYVGTINGGIIYFDSINQFTQYTIINSSLPDNSIVDIEIDQNGQPWFISPAAGLVNDSNLGGPWINYNNLNSGLPSNSLNCLIFTDNQLILGSEVSGLVFKDNDNWQSLNTSNSNLPDNHILSIQVDDFQNIWAGTFNAGLCKISLQNGIENGKQNSLLFYPNLITSGQEIQMKDSFTGSIQLVNRMGEIIDSQMIYNQNKWTIPRSASRGLYYVTLTNQNTSFTRPLMVY